MLKKMRKKIGPRRKYETGKGADGVTLPSNYCCSTGDEDCAWFFEDQHDVTITSSDELIDSDGTTASEFYLIVDKAVVRYDPQYTNVDQLYMQLIEQKFNKLRHDLTYAYLPGFSIVAGSQDIRIVQHYTADDITKIKMSVLIKPDYQVKLYVHDKLVHCDHDIWIGLPKHFETSQAVTQLLTKLNAKSVCVGNTDSKFQELVSFGSGVTESGDVRNAAHRERDMGASDSDGRYYSTIRSVNCELLCEGVRCLQCIKYRGTLRKLASRESEKNTQPPANFSNPWAIRKPFTYMTKEELIAKCRELRTHSVSMERTIDKMKRSIQKQIETYGPAGNKTPAHKKRKNNHQSVT